MIRVRESKSNIHNPLLYSFTFTYLLKAILHLQMCVCDCRQAGDSLRSCYDGKPLFKAYLPDERLLRRSGRTWPHVEAVPLHSGTADACDYDKCS